MDSHDVEDYLRGHQKLLAVLLLIIGMAAVSGMFMGMRQTDAATEIAAIRYDGEDELVASNGLPEAPKYGEIARSPWLANSAWKSSLDQLPTLDPPAADGTPMSPGELEQARAERASRRAFDGAPPVVPHAIDQMSAASCLACHSSDQQAVIGEDAR